MRWLPLLLLLTGCFPHLMPKEPVVAEPRDWLGADAPSGREYALAKRVTELPVVPFRPFGLDFEEEMLFEFASGDWGMVEIARIRDRQGEPHFFALVAARDGRQTVLVGEDADAELAASFPLPVQDGNLRVIRLAGEAHLEYHVAVYLPDGQLLQAHLGSKIHGRAPGKRNGNAMNHSADRVWGVIDLEESNWANAQVFLDGVNVPVRRLAGVLPLAQRLQQVNGGLAWGGVTVEADGEGLSWVLDDVDGAMPIHRERRGDELLLIGRDRIVDQTIRYRPLGDGWDGPVELVGVEVRHGPVSALDLTFNPALPDLRYPLDREYRSRFVAGINGQTGYAVGSVRVAPHEGRIRLEVLPRAPYWACERPIRNDLQIQRDRWRLMAQLDPAIAADGAGREACEEFAELE